MAERLNSLAYNETSGSNHSSSAFNPRSVSLDIRTPAELAAVNEFLLTLGRDVSCLSRPALAPSPVSNFSTDNYFDPSHLSQLGLTGMPGILPQNSGFADPTYGSSNTQYSNRGSGYYSSTRATQPAVPSQYGNMYDIHDSLNNYSTSNDYTRRPTKYSGSLSAHHHHPTPPLDNGSPHSTTSTPPVILTPPQLPLSMPDAFDYLRPSRGAPSVALAPQETMVKAMRQMIPLKSLPSTGRPPQPVEPKLPLASHRPRAVFGSTSSSSTSQSKSGSIYPLLTAGDVQLKLPPLNKAFRSSSRPSSRDSSPSTSTESSPVMQATVLPGIHSITSAAVAAHSSDHDDEHHLSRQVGKIELERSPRLRAGSISAEERKRHAEFILNLLVTVNQNFKNKYLPVDVEMGPP